MIKKNTSEHFISDLGGYDRDDYDLFELLDTSWPNATKQYMLMLYGLARSQGSRSIVELGLFRGNTSRVLLRAARKNGGSLVCIDKDKASCEALEKSLKGNMEGIKIFQYETTDPMFQKYHPDLLFIDADHTLKGVTSDWAFWSPLVTLGGFIVFHDSRTSPGVAQLVDAVFPNESFEYTHFPGDCGLTITRKVEECV